MQKNQSFYVYRNKRLIVWGTWFNKARKDILSQLARIKIDIPAEYDNLWTLEVKKSAMSPPSSVRKNLDSLIDKSKLIMKAEKFIILESIRENFTVKMAGTDALIQSGEQHELWLNQIRSEIDCFFLDALFKLSRAG